MSQDKIIVRGARQHNLKNITSRSRATRWSSSPGFPARGSPRSRSTRSTRRGSGGMWSRFRPTRGSSSGRWTSRMWTTSSACRPRSRSTRNRPPATRAPPSAPSPRSTTTCACSSRASATPTARSAGARSRSRPSSRWSMRSWRCRRARRFRSSRRSFEARRASIKQVIEDVRKEGFVRVRVDGEVHEVTDDIEMDRYKQHTIEVVVDRLVVKPGIEKRLNDSVETALRRATGTSAIDVIDERGDALLRELRLHRVRDQHGRDRAAGLLVQQPLRRVPGVPRPRQRTSAQPRPGDPGQGQVDRRGRDRPVRARAATSG